MIVVSGRLRVNEIRVRNRTILPAVAVALCLFAGRVWAQVVRLPAVMPANEAHEGQLISYPDSTVELPQKPLDLVPPPPEGPRDARPGVFQKIIFDYMWLARTGNAGLGMNELDLRAIFGLPCPTVKSPLIITPGFGVRYLDGPTNCELPPRLYNPYTQFRWMCQVAPRLGVDVAATIGVFSDFEQETSSALRTPSHIGSAYTWSPTTKIILGVAYPDREDVRVMPIAGIQWTPNPDTKFELVFPRPRIAKRVYWLGAWDDEVEDWVFISGEFGGGTWAFRRLNDTNDTITYHDVRVILGLQRKAIGHMDYRLEVGYSFAREIMFGSATPDVKPTDTVMLRGGLTY